MIKYHWGYLFGLIISLSQSGSTINVCETPTCRKLADHLLSCMNDTVDPCVNFYDFACGKWISENDIPDTYSQYGVNADVVDDVQHNIKNLLKDEDTEYSSMALRLVKLYYKICLNESRINNDKSREPLKLLQQFGGWPILMKNSWIPSTVDVSYLLGKLTQLYGNDYFISTAISPDPENSTINRFVIDQLPMILGSEDYYLNDQKYQGELSTYKQLIIDIVDILAGDMKITNVNYTEIDKMIELEKALARTIIPDERRPNLTLHYNVWSLQKLSATVPFLNWALFFDLTMPPDVRNLMKRGDFRMFVSTPQFMADLQSVLNSTEKRTIVNYAFWKFIYNNLDSLDNRFQDAYDKFAKLIYGIQKSAKRTYFCSASTFDNFPLAVGALYVRNYFTPASKKSASVIFPRLRTAFKSMIEKLSWMDSPTKFHAIEKLNSMKVTIGYPEIVFNDTSLDDEHKDLDFNENDSFFTVYQKVTSWKYYKMLNTLLKPTSNEFYDRSPAIVNAYYIKEHNVYVNFGATGATMGHELTHGFDDEGSQYDKDANLNNWWSDYSLKIFTTKTKCVEKQYNEYVLPGTDIHIRGDKTLTENIADLGGLKISFEAYKQYENTLTIEEPRLPGLERYSSDQMFFINFANFYCGKQTPSAALDQVLTDYHCPLMFRVNGVVVNLDSFANAFGCQKGSAMNPQPKCVIW